MTDSSNDYEKLWKFPRETGRDAFLIFYEEMLTDPAHVWQNLQEFLGLPQYDIPSMTTIHKTTSSGNPFDYMHQGQLQRMREDPSFAQWKQELSDGHFFKNSTTEWEAEFATICNNYKESKSVLRWRRSKCVKGRVEAHHEGLAGQ